MNTVHILTTYFFNIRFNINYRQRLGLQSDLSPSSWRLHLSCISHTIRVTQPEHLTALFNHLAKSSIRQHIVKPIIQFISFIASETLIANDRDPYMKNKIVSTSILDFSGTLQFCVPAL
jgi:hypothetical protein